MIKPFILALGLLLMPLGHTLAAEQGYACVSNDWLLANADKAARYALGDLQRAAAVAKADPRAQREARMYQDISFYLSRARFVISDPAKCDSLRGPRIAYYDEDMPAPNINIYVCMHQCAEFNNPVSEAMRQLFIHEATHMAHKLKKTNIMVGREDEECSADWWGESAIYTAKKNRVPYYGTYPFRCHYYEQ